jgi:hypothetical protein
VRITDSVTISSTLQQPWRKNKREAREWEEGREVRDMKGGDKAIAKREGGKKKVMFLKKCVG